MCGCVQQHGMRALMIYNQPSQWTHWPPKKMTLDETAVCIVLLARPSFLLCISCPRREDITECVRSGVAWAVLTLNGFFVITSELLPHQNKHKCQSELAYNGSKQHKPISPWVRNHFLMLSISHSLRDSKDHSQHWEWPWERIWLMSYHQRTFQCEVMISFTSWKCLMHVISLRGNVCQTYLVHCPFKNQYHLKHMTWFIQLHTHDL